jgi:hypothetical protein
VTIANHITLNLLKKFLNARKDGHFLRNLYEKVDKFDFNFILIIIKCYFYFFFNAMQKSWNSDILDQSLPEKSLWENSDQYDLEVWIQKKLLWALDFWAGFDEIIKKIKLEEILSCVFTDQRIKDRVIQNSNNIVKNINLSDPEVRKVFKWIALEIADKIKYAPWIAMLFAITWEMDFVRMFNDIDWCWSASWNRNKWNNSEDFFIVINAWLQSAYKEDYHKKVAIQNGWLFNWNWWHNTPTLVNDFMSYKDSFLQYCNLCDALGIEKRMYLDEQIDVIINPLEKQDALLYNNVEKLLQRSQLWNFKIIDSVKYLPAKEFNLFEVDITELSKDQKNMIVKIYWKQYVSDVLFEKYFG